MEEDEDFEDDWLKRLEPDFGQTDTFNGFLYSDRAVLHLLEADFEDPVYDVLDEFYNIEED